MITITVIKSTRNVVVGIKQVLRNQKKDFIQTHLEQNWSLDVIKGTYPDRVSCSMRTL